MVGISEYVIVAARVFLAIVFLLAGAAKLADPKGPRDALRNFGLPPRLAGPLGILLVLAELAVAATLASGTVTAWYGACGALALLLIFIAGIGANLARGRQPDCHCFGQLHSAPIGWPTLARNGILAACASWLIAQGQTRLGPNISAQFAALDTQQRRVAIVIAGLAGFLIVRALSPRKNAPEDNTSQAPPGQSQVVATPYEAAIETEPENPESPAIGPRGIGLPVGTLAPEFDLPDMAGENHSLRSLLQRGNPILLIFTNPHCIACQALVPKIAPWTHQYKDRIDFVLISEGTAQENLAKLSEFRSQVLLERNFEVSHAYDSATTPTAVLVGADGTIQSGLAEGRHSIQQFVDSLADLREQKQSS